MYRRFHEAGCVRGLHRCRQSLRNRSNSQRIRCNNQRTRCNKSRADCNNFRLPRKFYVLRTSATAPAIFHQNPGPPICSAVVRRAQLLCGVFLSSCCRVCPPEKRSHPTRSAFDSSLLWRNGYENMDLGLGDRTGCCGGPGTWCRALEFAAESRQSRTGSHKGLPHCPRLGQQHAPGSRRSGPGRTRFATCHRRQRQYWPERK